MANLDGKSLVLTVVSLCVMVLSACFTAIVRGKQTSSQLAEVRFRNFPPHCAESLKAAAVLQNMVSLDDKSVVSTVVSLGMVMLSASCFTAIV